MKHIALIGFGRIGQMHYQLIQQLPGLNVKYVVDPVVRHDIEITPLDKLQQVLTDPDISGVAIATSSDAHLELIELCMQHQKNIFCEKPISYDVGKLKSLKQKLLHHKARLQVGLNRRFDKDFSELKARIQQGEIGDIRIIKITNRDPKRPELEFVKRSGGLLYDFVIHDFDMLNYLTGKTVTDIAIQGDALIELQLQQLNDIDTAIIHLKLSDGSLAIIDVSRESGVGYDQRIEIHGATGLLKVENHCLSTITHHSESGGSNPNFKYSFVERYQDAYQQQFAAFRDLLSDEMAQPVVGINEIIAAVELADRTTKILNRSKVEQL